MIKPLEYFFAPNEYFFINWRGRERRLNTKGYLEVKAEEHPYHVDGWVLLHRLVIENYYKRFLQPLTVVHHVNHDKMINQVWNLILLEGWEHALVHRTGQKHTPETKAQMSRKHTGTKQNRRRGPGGQYVK